MNETEAKQFEAAARQVWDESPTIRAEFLGDFAIFAAYKKAAIEGRVKHYGRGRTGQGRAG